MKSVVILGGYGNFGRRIAEALAREPNTRVFVSGRDLKRATAVAQEIGGAAEPLRLDAHAGDFTAELRKAGATLVVHTAGPFQGQNYSIPQACVAAGAHYIDLADGRGFVCGITA